MIWNVGRFGYKQRLHFNRVSQRVVIDHENYEICRNR